MNWKNTTDILTSLNFRQHLLLGFVIRVLLIFYGVIQDELFHVPFTDIDYKVFSDAGRYVIAGNSPFKRHTYRYSPLIAYLAIPNHYIHPTFGKFIFSVVDIITTMLIYRILKFENKNESKCSFYSLFWLYNPLSIVISCRGNSDSISAFLVLLTLYYYKEKSVIKAGLIHGLSVHLRLYPIIYSLPFYFSLKINKSLLDLIYPSYKRIKFVFSFAASFSFLFLFFYYIYGNEFLNESLLYHLKRVDIRHNYSVYFYLQYLNYELNPTIFQKIFMACPLLALLVCFPLYFNRYQNITAAMFFMSFAFVTYNSVLTCQYFIWYLCLLPLVIPFINCPAKKLITVSILWLLSQLSWLLPAYLLEFKFKNTFIFIWVQGIIFFVCNIILLSTLLRGYLNKIKSS